MMQPQHLARFGTPAQRLAQRTERTADGCLEWTGTLNNRGYGQTWADGHQILAHRLAYTLANGPIPAGMKVLHRCDNPPCCDPAHLFLGTTKDNADDMFAKGRSRLGEHQRNRTHCPSGHPYDDVNTYTDPRGGRRCRTCRAAQDRAHQARKAMS